MNDENKPSVIAELTGRTWPAWRNVPLLLRSRAEQYKKSSDEWYQFFNNKDRELKDTQAELQKVREALEAKEGEQNHGNNKESNS